jgi:predicted nucleic acid-binding Zn ribbon protein
MENVCASATKLKNIVKEMMNDPSTTCLEEE